LELSHDKSVLGFVEGLEYFQAGRRRPRCFHIQLTDAVDLVSVTEMVSIRLLSTVDGRLALICLRKRERFRSADDDGIRSRRLGPLILVFDDRF